MPVREGRSDGITLAAFVAMVVGIGGNVIAVKFIAREGDFEPLWAAGSRFVVAAAIFVVIALGTGAPMPRGRALTGALLYGALSLGGFFALVYYGLQDAPAGVAGVILASGPLLTYLFAMAHKQERFRWDSAIGALGAIAGTAVILGAEASRGVPLLSMLAILGASVCAAEGAVLVKAFPAVAPAARNAIGMAVAAVMLLVLVPLFGESPTFSATATTWLSQVYLITVGSVGVFGLYLFVLSRWTASAASYEFVLAPVVGIALAAWLLDEPVTTTFVVGAALILAGVYFGALRPGGR